MSETDKAVVEELPLEGAGQRLRRAREEQGLELAQVAAQTRIPIRHLQVIEQGAFGKLPAPTYATGFSRSYARMLGLDEQDIIGRVRSEMAYDTGQRTERSASFDPGDPAKTPSAALAWTGAIAAIILFVGGVMFYNSWFGAGADPAPLVATPVADAPSIASSASTPQQAAQPAAAAGAPGQVVFTALEDGIWVRFFDADGTRLLEKTMATGESFAIPPDAPQPRINTGRPDAFAITVGGRPVPKLAEGPTTIGGAEVSARALLARAETDEAAQVN